MATVTEALVWSQGCERRWPIPGESRCVARYDLSWLGAVSWRLTGSAHNLDGVRLFVAAPHDPKSVSSGLSALIEKTPRALLRRLRRIEVLPRASARLREQALNCGVQPFPAGLATLDGAIWFCLEPEPDLSFSSYLFWHELSHTAGGCDGGAPGYLKEAWESARLADAAHQASMTKGFDAGPQALLCLGTPFITPYARESAHPREDWAEAVALYQLDATCGRFLSPSDAGQLIGRPSDGLRFQEVCPARASLICGWLAEWA